jgi:hypothetical protein
MKYVLAGLGIVVVVFLAILLIFGLGGDSDQPANTPRVTKLADYASKNSVVSVTTIGKVVGYEEHRSIRVVVSPNERRLEVLSGYDRSVITSQSYPNTSSAYETFLVALSGQGFLSKRQSSITDHRSVCPSGNHYTYDLTDDSQQVSSLWSVSCSAKTGTFAGNGQVIRELFQRQIPNYSKQVSGVKL